MASAVRRRMEAARSKAEAAALTRMAGVAIGERDPLPALVDHLRATFAADAAAVLRRSPAGWRTEVSSGAAPPGRARGGDHHSAPGRRCPPGPAGRAGGGRGPGRARRLRRPPGGGGAEPGTGGGGGGGRPLGVAQPVAVHHPQRGVPRLAHSALVDQGRGLQPAPDRRLLERVRPRGVPGHHRGGSRPPQLARGEPPRHEPAAGRGAVAGAAPGGPRRGGAARPAIHPPTARRW